MKRTIRVHRELRTGDKPEQPEQPTNNRSDDDVFGWGLVAGMLVTLLLIVLVIGLISLGQH